MICPIDTVFSKSVSLTCEESKAAMTRAVERSCPEPTRLMTDVVLQSDVAAITTRRASLVVLGKE